MNTQLQPPLFVWLCALLTLLTLLTVSCGDEEVPTKVQATPSCTVNCEETDSGGADEDIAEDTSEDTSEDISPDTLEDIPPPDLPRIITSVETVLSTTETSAGSNVVVTCLFKDSSGEDVALDQAPRAFILTSPETSFEENPEPNTITPIRTGQASVACLVPSLTLKDFTPATLDVTPGPPYSTVLSPSAYTLTAGETLSASCDVYDPFGNLIPEEPWELTLDPPSPPSENDAPNARTITRSGIYTLLCQHPTATQLGASSLEVVPDLPAELVVSPNPAQDVYNVGQLVEFNTGVFDRFGNTVRNAQVSSSSSPEAISFGTARWRFEDEGIYTITTRVEGPTHDDVALEHQDIIEVGGLGPAVTCTSPTHNAMISGIPGTQITLTGTVQDPNGVESVLVRGQSATLDANGTFSIDIDTRFGINFVDVLAIDSNGSTNTTTCAFLLSEAWAAEDAYLTDAISLRLLQGAFDDTDRSDPLDSLNDLLFSAVNSSAVRDTLHAELSNNNPLKADSCDQETCITIPFAGRQCTCILRSRVDYVNSELNGPHTTTLSLLDRGLRADVRLSNIRVRVRVRGRATAIPYDTTGWVTLSQLSTTVNFHLRLQNGQPYIAIRSVENTQVGSISTSFSGLDGAIINIVVGLFEGSVRNLIRDELRNFLQDSFDDILSNVISGLDISSLGTEIEIPTLDGGDPITLGFGVRFSDIDVTTSRALFTLAPLLSTTPAHATPSLGIPIPSGALRDDPGGNNTAVASIHTAFLNQALHTLWRGGLLHTTLDGETLSGLPDGTRVNLTTQLPPTIVPQDDGNLLIALAGLDLQLVWPGLFDDPIRLLLGAEATTSAELVNGDTLAFDPVAITRLSFSTPGINLDPTTKNILENFLQTLVQNIANSTLNDAIPTLPIPAFDIPNTLTDFGIPATSLGLRNPSIFINPNHIQLRGDFGTP